MHKYIYIHIYIYLHCYKNPQFAPEFHLNLCSKGQMKPRYQFAGNNLKGGVLLGLPWWLRW